MAKPNDPSAQTIQITEVGTRDGFQAESQQKAAWEYKYGRISPLGLLRYTGISVLTGMGGYTIYQKSQKKSYKNRIDTPLRVFLC